MGKTKATKKPDTNPSQSSDIFESIFGRATLHNPAGSIFSDDNPFKRKPQNLGLWLASGEEVNKTVDSQDAVNGEPKKTKRNKEKRSSHDLDSATEASLETKKSKKEKLIGSSNLVSEITERKDVDEKRREKKKNKRKRDELENVYELKMYGGASGETEVSEKGKIVGGKRKKVDDPADLLVSKEGFDDESKLLRTVFVGNLPLKVKKKALLKEFSQFGELESVRIRSVPILDTKAPRRGAVLQKKINESIDNVHAYIVFKNEEFAQASLAHNMAVVGGNHIRVDRACPPRKKLKGDNTPLYDNKRTVFVGNLPFDVKDEEIFQLFSGINLVESIEAVRVIRDPHTSVGKGIAYVLFKTADVAASLVKKRNLKLRDRELRISRARSDSTPSKRKNPSSELAPNSPSKKRGMNWKNTSDGHNSIVTSSMSYQGLHASKTGVVKKARGTRIGPVQSNSRTREANKKTRESKRPSVAARKARGQKDGNVSKEAGNKRKLESRTPESSQRMKKTRKF